MCGRIDEEVEMLHAARLGRNVKVTCLVSEETNKARTRARPNKI